MKKTQFYFRSIACIAILICALTNPINGQNTPPYLPSNGLVAWWPFNGNANDESGNSLNGTIIGAALTTDRFGAPNKAYNFTHVGAVFGQQHQEIYIPYDSLLNFNHFTISVWVYPRAYFWPGNNNRGSAIIKRVQYGYSNPNGQTWALEFNEDWVKAFICEASNFQQQNSAVIYYQSPLELNKWTHVALTYNGVQLKLFLDAIKVDSFITTLPLNTMGHSGISIGESNQANGYWHHLDGKVDDIAIWNRALSQTEVNSIFNGCDSSYIANHPTDLSGTLGNTVTFAVSTTDSLVSFQWQTDIGLGFVDLSNAGQYSGVDSDSLTVSLLTMSNNNQKFRCTISNGGCIDTSDVAIIMVNDAVYVTEIESISEFYVSPNPSIDLTTLISSKDLLYKTFTVLNIHGKHILSDIVYSSKQAINLTGLRSGVYFIRFPEYPQHTVRFVKL